MLQNPGPFTPELVPAIEVYVAMEYAGQATTEAQAIAVARYFADSPCRCLLRKCA